MATHTIKDDTITRDPLWASPALANIGLGFLPEAWAMAETRGEQALAAVHWMLEHLLGQAIAAEEPRCLRPAVEHARAQRERSDSAAALARHYLALREADDALRQWLRAGGDLHDLPGAQAICRKLA